MSIRINYKSFFLFIVFSVSMLYTNIMGAQSNDSDCETEVSKKSNKLKKKAIDELRLGHYSTASHILQNAIDISPENLKALWILADINRRSTNRNRVLSMATESYEQIIDICPAYEDYYSYYYLAGIYYSQQNYSGAYKMYEAFLNADDDDIKEEHFEQAQTFSMYAKFYADIYDNKVPFNPHQLKGVTTSDDEYLPIITPDGEFIFFTRRMEEENRTSAFGKADNRVERFCIARSTSVNCFEKGSPLPKPFNTQTNEGGAALTIDNTDLYFTYCKVVGVGQRRNLECDIATSHYSYNKWSDIEIVENINMPGDSWESMPTISSNGKTLYFVSNRKEGSYGGYDIYKSLKDDQGMWQAPINLGSSINTPGNEKTPFIHTDSQTLYFSSSNYQDRSAGEVFRGHMGIGGYDIFYSRLDSNNKWIKPINIGFPINTKNDDLGFSVSTDGRYGYFSSNKVESEKENNKDRNIAQKKSNVRSPYNMYSFELYKEARPQKVVFVKGTVEDEEVGKPVRDARVFIKNVETKEITEIPINMETGKFVAAIVTKNDLTLMVKKKNYAYVTKYIEQEKEDQPAKPVNLDVKLKEIEVGVAYDLQDVYFDTDSDVLKKMSVRVIEGFYDFLQDNPNVKVEIQGHTDNVGSDAYNLKLSNERAKSVYQVLLDMGTSISQITHKGYGETNPIASNNTNVGKAKNRRTVFVIISK